MARVVEERDIMYFDTVGEMRVAMSILSAVDEKQYSKDPRGEDKKLGSSVGLVYEISELNAMVVKLGGNLDTLTGKLDFILNASDGEEALAEETREAEELPTISQAAGAMREVRTRLEAINFRLITTIWRVDL